LENPTSFILFLLLDSVQVFSNSELIQKKKAFRVTGIIHPYNPLEVYSRLTPHQKSKPLLLLPILMKEYQQAWYLLTGIPECQAIHPIDFREASTSSRSTHHQKHSKLEDELHKHKVKRR